MNDNLDEEARILVQILKSPNGISQFKALYDKKHPLHFKEFIYSSSSFDDFDDNVINDLISIISFMKISKKTNIEMEMALPDNRKSSRRGYTGTVNDESYNTLQPGIWLNDVIINTWIDW